MDLSLRDRNCPICGADSGELFAESNVAWEALDTFAWASRKAAEYMHRRLLACRACDLLYANAAPSREQVASLYHAADFASAREAGYAARTYGELLPEIVSGLPDRDGDLDIGTGEGAFLKELL